MLFVDNRNWRPQIKKDEIYSASYWCLLLFRSDSPSFSQNQAAWKHNRYINLIIKKCLSSSHEAHLRIWLKMLKVGIMGTVELLRVFILDKTLLLSVLPPHLDEKDSELVGWENDRWWPCCGTIVWRAWHWDAGFHHQALQGRQGEGAHHNQCLCQRWAAPSLFWSYR